MKDKEVKKEIGMGGELGNEEGRRQQNWDLYWLDKDMDLKTRAEEKRD